MVKKKTIVKSLPDDIQLTMSEPYEDEDKYVLRLYVTGSTSRSALAITNLKKICDNYLKGRYELEIIDLYLKPGRAKGDQIIAAPTLIKELPLPFRRIIAICQTEIKCFLD